ncbi:MAG: hypothetical protein PHY16_18940 [Methylobacter sp.]|nr:hypothetical protein [Methylobacter sp.]
MQKTNIVDELRALATSSEKRPDTARLRDIFNDIEATLTAGVSRADVHKTLQKHGFTMTLRGFETALYRIRKQRRQKSGQNLNTPSKENATAATTPDSLPEAENNHNKEEEEQDNVQTIFNPADLRALLNKKIDLAALSKLGKEAQRKKKDENSRN